MFYFLLACAGVSRARVACGQCPFHLFLLSPVFTCGLLLLLLAQVFSFLLILSIVYLLCCASVAILWHSVDLVVDICAHHVCKNSLSWGWNMWYSILGLGDLWELFLFPAPNPFSFVFEWLKLFVSVWHHHQKLWVSWWHFLCLCLYDI